MLLLCKIAGYCKTPRSARALSATLEVTALASIDSFVNRRWEDAKDALRKLDNDFVSRLESEHRVQTLGLDMPERYSVGFTPKKRLSKQWHYLLESCLELTMQVWNVKVAAVGQIPEANASHPIHEVGVRADYHFRSWFIHVQALAERADDLIRKATTVYIDDPENRTEIAKRHQTSVRQQIIERVQEQRNSYLHARRSWGSGNTKEQLWEGNVAIGMTPTKFLDEFHYPDIGNRTMAGKYKGFVAETTAILDGIGSILQELEADL